jgi:hypothetical protein
LKSAKFLDHTGWGLPTKFLEEPARFHDHTGWGLPSKFTEVSANIHDQTVGVSSSGGHGHIMEWESASNELGTRDVILKSLIIKDSKIKDNNDSFKNSIIQ